MVINKNFFVAQDVNLSLEREGIREGENSAGGMGGGGSDYLLRCELLDDP